ncbi:MAG: urea ABC transporter permease subunit UrtB [Acetobacteraceae bacterium]|nr:urea ABC transporter permease subunit UrtB [Acetobacteraceae bacterium]
MRAVASKAERAVTKRVLARFVAPLLAIAAGGRGRSRSRARAACAVLGLWFVFAQPARAQPTGAELLGSSNFADIQRGVEAVAGSGDPHALPILAAMQEGRLYARGDRSLAAKSSDGSYTDPLTGAAIANPGAVKPVRLNNNVRRALDAALGALRLFSPDPGTRQIAAEAIFKGRDPAALPALNRAIGEEKEPGVNRTMEQARASALLLKNDASDTDKLAAIATLRDRGDIDARAMLATLATGQPPAVTAAVAEAVNAIDLHLRLWSWLQNAYYGLSLGSVLLLAAAGLAITFGVMGVINMAHGELLMIGAYATYLVQNAIRAHAPLLSGASLLIAVPVAFVVAGAVGIAIERLMIRYLYGRPLETLLATFGLSLVLQQGVRSIFGPTNLSVTTPDWMSGAIGLGGLSLTANRLCIILFAIAVFAALQAALRYTSLGLRMRAVTQNRRMASAMGIRTPWIDAMTFGLGSGVAGMAGVALSQIDNVSPNLGQGYIIDSFMVVVFGGVGNLWGTAVGALTLGVLNKFLEPVAGAVLGKIVVLIAIILFIQRRPRGLFPTKGRFVEA